MEILYLGCAVLGGTVLVCQFVMTLVGIGGDHDLGGDHEFGHDAGHALDHDHTQGDAHEHGSSWFIGVLTFRTIVAALTFFGLAGMFGNASDYTPTTTLLIAVAAGTAALFLVAWMMRALVRMKSEGTIRIERAVGANGTVYLTVPANKSGIGKVTLNIQERTMEYQAVTSEQNELPTGAKVVAVAVIGPGTVEVAPVPS
jgi:hypothetical protein